MSALLDRLAYLIGVEQAGVTAPPAAEAAGEAVAPTDEATAREAVQRAQATLTDLAARRDSTIKTIEALVAERSAVGRRLATGELTDADFAGVESQLDAALARRDGLDELLVEAEDARREAQLALNATQAPRLAAERRQRVEAATAKAQAASERFSTLYAEASAALAALADDLDTLAMLDGNAAFNVGYPLGVVSGDPQLVLTRAGWKIRQWSQYVPVEFRLCALVPPAGFREQ